MRTWLAVVLAVAAVYVGFLLFTGRFLIGAAALTHPVGDYWLPQAQTVSCFKDVAGSNEIQVVVAFGADVKDVAVQLKSETPAAIDVVATGSQNVFAGDVIGDAQLEDRIVHLSGPRGNRPVTSRGASIEVCSGLE